MVESFEAKYLQSLAEIQRLAALIESLQLQLQQANQNNEELRKLLTDLQSKLDVLISQTKKRNKRDYGKTTEKHNPRPALLPCKENSADDIEQLNQRGTKTISVNAEHLPHQSVPHLLSSDQSFCPDCAVPTVFVHNLISKQLEMVSAHLKVLEHHQETRSCPKCKLYIRTAQKPSPPIPGSYAGPRLLAEVIVGKLDDGLPNYRQGKRFARDGVVIPRSTQSDWMQSTASTLSLLYDLSKQKLFESEIIKTDDSSIKIQDRTRKDNLRKGKITTYVGDAKSGITMFDYSPNLSFAKNAQFLQHYSGIVQADAAGGFDALFTDGTKIEAGCHAHSRRKYFEYPSSEDQLRNTVLEIYRDLYKIEYEIKNKSAAVRLAIRRRKSKPLIKILRQTIERAKHSLTPAHELMKAISYTLKHWIALTQFLKNPNIAIDNNAAERAIKCWVLVRKNSLFAGSDQGAQAIAIHLSFIASAKRNGINPVDWYADVLARINDMKTNELEQLLPTRWTKPAS